VPIITWECGQGSVIHSDEWPAYSTLKVLGFIHSTVNHQENYVNPASGTNTQGIERSWLDAKIKILRKMRENSTVAAVPPKRILLQGNEETLTEFVN
jgi:hypothetical protein